MKNSFYEEAMVKSQFFHLLQNSQNIYSSYFEHVFKLGSRTSQDRPNQHKNSHKLSDETGHPVMNLMENQWKLRQQDDQKFPMKGKSL